MSTMLSKEQFIAECRSAGIAYVGPAEFNRVFNAAEATPSGPPSQPEPMPHQLVGAGHSDILVDRYSLTPGPDYVRQLLPGAVFVGPAPTMFANNRDLPLITGCGADPQILRSLPWVLRHAGAMTGSRAHLAALLEEGADGDPDSLQTREGRGLLNDYLARVRAWAATPPPIEPLTDDDINAMLPPHQQLGS